MSATLTYKCSFAGFGRGFLFVHSRFFFTTVLHLEVMSLRSRTPCFFPYTPSRAKTLAKPACRVTVKSRIPSRYFAFSRIPRCISDPERIPFLTVVLVSLWQLDNTLLKSEVRIRFDTRNTCAFRAIMTFYERYLGLFLPVFELLLRQKGENWHLNCKGPQTNLPQNVGSIEDLISKLIYSG